MVTCSTLSYPSCIFESFHTERSCKYPFRHLVAVLVTQSCPTYCDHMVCILPGSSVRGDPPGKSTGVGCHSLLQGIFPTQGSNPALPHCRQILYRLSQQGLLSYLLLPVPSLWTVWDFTSLPSLHCPTLQTGHHLLFPF